MKSCQIFSVVVAAVSFLSTPLLYAGISSECFRYHPQSEHYKTCKKYDKSKIKVLSDIIDLNEAVNNAQEGELLIIPARDKDNPYLLTGPLELKNGMGLLSSGRGVQGFFHVAPDLNFSIGDQSVYSLVKMAEGSVITGLGIDARTFSAGAARTLKGQDIVKKTLVYASGIRQFTLTRASLFGRAGLTPTIWADNEHSVEATGGTYEVSQSWLESSGAENVAVFAGSGDPSTSPEVNLEQLMVIISGGTADADQQRGLWLKAVKGEVGHNYLFLAESNSGKERKVLAIDGVSDSGRDITPALKENYFYTASKNDTQNESVLQFSRSGANSTAGMFAKVRIVAPSWKKFFDEVNGVMAWSGRRGNCLAPLFAVTNLGQATLDDLNLVCDANDCGDYQADNRRLKIRIDELARQVAELEGKNNRTIVVVGVTVFVTIALVVAYIGFVSRR